MSGYGKQILYTAALGIVISLAIGLGIYYANPGSVYSPVNSSTTSTSTQPVFDPKEVCQSLPPIAHVNATSNPSSHYASFAIIDADSGPFMGMNGSAVAWQSSYPSSTTETIVNQSSTITTTAAESVATAPVMRVYLGQVVTITVYDCSSETHGLAINYYSPSPSITIAPNESSAITFTANETGNFQVYEQIMSAMHPFMQSGLLIVESSG